MMVTSMASTKPLLALASVLLLVAGVSAHSSSSESSSSSSDSTVHEEPFVTSYSPESDEVWPFGWDAATTTPGTRVVTTKYGRVRGVIVRPRAKTLRAVEAYLGVPYATPPEKDLRYVPPVTPPPWDHVWNADRVRPVCPQELPLTPGPSLDNDTEALSRMPKTRLAFLKTIVKLLGNQSEDCLYMNIFVPTNPGTFDEKIYKNTQF